MVGFTKGINGGWREAGTEHGVRTRRAECGERAGSAREAESRVVLGVRVDAETEGREGEHRPSGERDGSPGLAEARRPPGRAGQRARGDSQGRPSAVTLHRTRDDKDQRRGAARSSKARRQTVFLGPDAKTFRCDVCPSTLCDAGATPTPQPRPGTFGQIDGTCLPRAGGLWAPRKKGPCSMLGSRPGGRKGAPAACEDWQVQGTRAKPHLGETRGPGRGAH